MKRKIALWLTLSGRYASGIKATKVTIYHGKLGKAKEIGAAVRGWAMGTSATCPNLNG